MGGVGLDSLPSCILIDNILCKLEMETLCSLACVNTSLKLHVSQILISLTALNLSGFSPTAQILSSIVGGCRGLRSLTLNCISLDDSSLAVALGPHLEELNLLRCSLMSIRVLVSIGEACPNLRVLVLELVNKDYEPAVLKFYLDQMLHGCLCLESVSLKIRDRGMSNASFQFFLPKTLKIIKLQQVLEQDAVNFFSFHDAPGNHLLTAQVSTISNFSFGFTLQQLSLVLNVISDQLISAIVTSLHAHLVELHLEDRPVNEPLPNHDLTNEGVMLLASRLRLKGLSLVRSRQNYAVSFTRVDDIGMFVLSKNCMTLESVKICGFSKVSDAGYASILQSSPKLKKFEVRNTFLLSDLAFFDLNQFPLSLVEVKLLSCCLITSETVKQLTGSGVLEVLDLSGSRSVADSCLSSVASLHNLTMLNLSGADISDFGLSVLGKGNLPVTRLCLRNCKSVTDKGVSNFFLAGGTIGKTLSFLDLAYNPGISDKAVLTIAMAGMEIIELCLRFCSSVTGLSLEALATKKQNQDECKPLRRLDLSGCRGLSLNSLDFLKRPYFPGLQWIGLMHPQCSTIGFMILEEIASEKPWLTICHEGCEMGCHNGWQYHSDCNAR